MRALNKNNIDVRYAEVGGERTMQDRRVKDGHLLLLNINYDTHSANHTTYIISNFFFHYNPSRDYSHFADENTEGSLSSVNLSKVTDLEYGGAEYTPQVG